MKRYRPFTRQELGGTIGTIYGMSYHVDSYDPLCKLNSPKRKAHRRKQQRRLRTGRRK